MNRMLCTAVLLMSILSLPLSAQDAAEGEANDQAKPERPERRRDRRPDMGNRRAMMERRRAARTHGRDSIQINPRMMDTNRDLIVSDEEIAAAMPKLKEQIKETQAVLLKTFDKDGDGVLNEDEQSTMQEAAQALSSLRSVLPYDLNGDMLLDDQEIEKISGAVKDRADRTNQMVLRRFDKNQDGKIDEEEAKSMPGARRTKRERPFRGKVGRDRDKEKGDDKE